VLGRLVDVKSEENWHETRSFQPCLKNDSNTQASQVRATVLVPQTTSTEQSSLTIMLHTTSETSLHLPRSLPTHKRLAASHWSSLQGSPNRSAFGVGEETPERYFGTRCQRDEEVLHSYFITNRPPPNYKILRTTPEEKKRQ